MGYIVKYYKSDQHFMQESSDNMIYDENDLFYQRAKALTEQLTEEEKLGLLTTHHHAVERLGLPEFYIGCEVARGYVGRSEDKPSTVFPQPIGLAATFDRELMERLGEIAGDEARAYYNEEKRGGLALWGPTVDMVRDPRWGRTEEAYGEDVCLAGELTAAYTRGMAGVNGDGFYKTVPTLKHFCANNNEERRFETDSYLPPRLKYEYYYAAFENAIRCGGAKSVMAAYNEINGLPAIMNPELQSVLKDEWGLWFVVSDGGDFSQNVTSHRYTESYAEAYKLSLTAGSDAMTDVQPIVRNAAEEALAEGLITWEDIDRSIVNTLYARLRLGQLDDTEFDGIGKEVIDCPAHREVNARAAREQMVLLKNDGILPLGENSGRIAVVGAMADESLMDWYTGYATYRCTVLEGMRKKYGEVVHDSLWDIVAVKAPNGKYLCAYEDGSVRADSEEICEGAQFELQDWGENWCNLFSVKFKRYVRLFDGDVIKLHNRTIYDWFTRETFNLGDYGGRTVIEEFLHHRRLVTDESGELTVKAVSAVTDEQLFDIEVVSRGSERGKKLAAECDAVIYCVGNYPVQTAKECYDRKTLALNVQPGMTQALAAANPRTVLAVISSYPYAICEESESAAAVIWSSHAGAELGSAFADTVSGDNDPSGRLPLTWYRSELDLPDILDYDIETAGSTYMYFRGKPLYPFGHGLSYASFEYLDMKVEQNYSDALTSTVIIRNTSDRDGVEVVQIYFTMKDSAVSRPIKKLCGFKRVTVGAGETLSVTVSIPLHQLRIYDVRAAKMIVESGEYLFTAGASSEDIRLSSSLRVQGGEPMPITGDTPELRREQSLSIINGSLAPRGGSFLASSFDTANGIRLRYSQMHLCECVYVKGWSADLSYGGLTLEGAKALEIRALSMLGIGKLTAQVGEFSAEAELSPANDRGDFSVCRIELPEGISGDTLTLHAGEWCHILDIKIVR